jgi:hypothetical protein
MNHSLNLTCETLYQNSLLASIFNPDKALSDGASDGLIPLPYASTAQGLAAYHNNGAANAVNALASMHPSVRRFLGESDFYHLSKGYWLAHPPSKGDWSQHLAAHGYCLGDWIARSNYGGIASALPFLADLARLDDALSTAQDTLDSLFDSASLNFLTQDASTLRIKLMPAVSLLSLDYELITLRTALQENHSHSHSHSLTHTPVHLASKQCVLISRIHWRSHAHAVDAASAECIKYCLLGTTIAHAHAAACAIDAQFNFSTWLLQLLQWKSVQSVQQTSLVC